MHGGPSTCSLATRTPPIDWDGVKDTVAEGVSRDTATGPGRDSNLLMGALLWLCRICCLRFTKSRCWDKTCCIEKLMRPKIFLGVSRTFSADCRDDKTGTKGSSDSTKKSGYEKKYKSDKCCMINDGDLTWQILWRSLGTKQNENCYY